MKNQGNTSPSKEYSKPLVTGPKENDIQKLPNKKFKIIVPQMLRELQKNTDKQFHTIRKTTEEQNEKFNIEVENIKRTKIKNFGVQEYSD